MKIFFSKKSFLLFCSVLLTSAISFGQRGGSGTNPIVTLVPTITHGTCGNPFGSLSYYISVSTGWIKGTKVNTLVLKDESGNTVYDHINMNPASSPNGTVSNLPVGTYNFTGSVTVQNSSGNWISVPLNTTIWIGIQTVWKDLVDMIASPNGYSAKRNLTQFTYGGALSTNRTALSKFWIEMKPTYGGTTNSNVYWVIGETSTVSTFNPNANIQYIQFYRTTGGSGVRVKYRQTNGVYTTTTVSGANYYDKIRVSRNGTTLIIQINDNTTTAFTFPSPSTGAVNIAVFGLQLNDGAFDVISSMPCVYDNHYHYLKSSIEESIAYVNGNLKFKFEENYFDNSQTLEYQIKDLNTNNATPVSGTLTKLVEVDFYSINILGGGLNLVSGRTYLLTVTNEKGIKSYLKFKVA